jgi:cation transport protein ChaC
MTFVRDGQMGVDDGSRDSGGWRRKIEASPLGGQLLTDADRAASIERTLRVWDGKQDIWLFAYGSLIWKPQLKFEEMRVGTVHGYHRSFCLWSRINRGTPERPGLVLGLDRGGSCRGVAYRLPASAVRGQLDGLWKREMMLNAYHPTWARFRAQNQGFPVLTFVVNRGASGYTSQLSDQDMLEALRSAHGRYGPCADYLVRTVEGLAAHGITDRRLARLHKLLISAN